jgi:putative intracellular protease/amidase
MRTMTGTWFLVMAGGPSLVALALLGAPAGLAPPRAAAADRTPPPATAGRLAPAAESWVCPMRCVPVATQPGSCSACGMALVLAATLPPPHPNEERPPEVAAYICSKGDGTEDVAAGTCPTCGAEMVLASRPLRAAILIFDGVQIIDYCGPFEVFGQGRVESFTVAKTADTVTTNMGMKVLPSRTFADCPPAEIMIIPGGTVDDVTGDPAAIAWLRERANRAQFVLSVCNGAFILAETGLLDGLTATTFYDLLEEFEGRYPKVKAVRDRRFVDNGKFVTTAGISSGIDGSLHVIAKLRGRATAERTALNMEYDWKQDARYARASFADRHLRRIFDRNLRLRILDGILPLVVHTRGDRDRWEVEWRIATSLTPGELLARLDRTVEERGPWTRSSAAAAGAGATGSAGATARSGWRFDESGATWKGVTEIEPEPTPNRYRVRVRVERS